MQQYFKQMNQDERRYQTRSQSLFASKCFRVQMYIMDIMFNCAGCNAMQFKTPNHHPM